MRNILFAIVFAMCFSRSVSADSILPPPGVDLCAQYNICGTPTTIEVELGGKGTDTWTGVIELSEIVQQDWYYFSDGSSLPPGSIWTKFLFPSGDVGLSSPFTWRDVVAPTTAFGIDQASSAVPEPSALILTCLGLAVLLATSRYKKH